MIPEEYRKSTVKRENLGKKLMVGLAVGNSAGVVNRMTYIQLEILG